MQRKNMMCFVCRGKLWRALDAEEKYDVLPCVGCRGNAADCLQAVKHRWEGFLGTTISCKRCEGGEAVWGKGGRGLDVCPKGMHPFTGGIPFRQSLVVRETIPFCQYLAQRVWWAGMLGWECYCVCVTVHGATGLLILLDSLLCSGSFDNKQGCSNLWMEQNTENIMYGWILSP